MLSFVTLCEAYMGIEPHFQMWNYFFYARLRQGSDMEVAALFTVDIFIRSSHGVDPYFLVLTFDPPDGWQKVWFSLWNDTDAPLPVFTGSRPIPNPTGHTA
jgi:hypothetical protein